MSATGAQKALVTEAVNVLRQNTAEVDPAILGRLILTGTPGEDQDLLYDRKTILSNTSASIRRSLNSLKERWEHAVTRTESSPAVEGEPTLLDELMAHRESLGADEFEEKAEDLLSRLDTALSLLPSLNCKADVPLLTTNPAPYSTSTSTLSTQALATGVRSQSRDPSLQCHRTGNVPEEKQIDPSSR